MLPPSIDMASGRGPAPAGSSTAALGEIADQLADAVRVQLLREERSGVVAGPAPIPVHWIPTGHTTTPPALAGRFHQIGEVYQRIPSRRLAILGKEGSGKTTLAARLAVDLLAARGPGGRVPVVGTIESWNPSTSLGQWLATQLVHDYPGLAAPGPDGSTCASGLLATQRILPILDGFDELDPELRQAALRQLNMAPGLPLVLTSRPGEYAAAARSEGALVSAAEITLDDLIPDDLTGYLVHATRHATRHGTADSRADRWRSVLDVLRTYPDDPVATVLRQALSTPLMVSLARTVYSGTDGRDPAELLDRRRFPTRWAVEEHLLSAYVPACYQRPAPAGRRWNPDRGQRWLSHLANDLDRRGTRDLAWRHLHDAVPRATRVVVFGFLCALLIGLWAWATAWLMKITFIHWFGSVAGLLAGLVGGLSYGLGTPERKSRGTRLRIRGRVRYALLASASTLVGGLLLGITIGSVLGWERWILGGIVGGFGFVLLFECQPPIEVATATSPSATRASARNAAIRAFLAHGLVLGLLVEAQIKLTSGPMVGATVGILGGIAAGLLAGLRREWGYWLVLVRIWLPLTGRLPWSVVAFLTDASHRGILRRTGEVHQFRHLRIQDHLADVSTHAPPHVRPPGGA